MGGDRFATVVIVGGGHSGLAMSKRLSDRSVDHVVLERGEVANSWRTQRWDAFTLLTPNWQNRLRRGHVWHDTGFFWPLQDNYDGVLC
jgi:cation diffusion facilitator CzcD-associated flavoprotein CzcO